MADDPSLHVSVTLKDKEDQRPVQVSVGQAKASCKQDSRAVAAAFKELDPMVFDYWKESENVAMHFNDLLVRFRIQALALLVATGTILIFASRMIEPAKDATSAVGGEASLTVLTVGLFSLAFIWVIVAVVDFFYYQRLLEGAIKELLRIENDLSGGAIQLSHQIESVCTGRHSKGARWFFYVATGLLLVALGTLTLFPLPAFSGDASGEAESAATQDTRGAGETNGKAEGPE